MATTLLELTQQGDPGTLQSEEQARKIQLLGPQQLYELWERQNWVSHEIDFSRDIEQWKGLSGEDRDWAVWSLASFFIGEERVTTQFSALVMAYEDEQEEAFLTTQQVREDLNDAFVQLFDTALVTAAQRLIEDPRDPDAKVDFVTTYHMVIEGTLALTGQHFITKYFDDRGMLPGFVEGFNKVARDEHRHVAYGTWYLKQACGRDERLADRMRATLTELLPVANGVLVPQGKDPNEEWEMVGYTSAEIHEFAFNALTRRLKAIGVPLTTEPVAA